ncbi:GntR family transcriptional regulator [Kitasatospora sp. NBC_00315]|uniref:GntR family transcriptional regulator n=1 Tax=Kitasatospora sp. NBC_00315 TaxID=2975963 RepID=UPI00324FB7B1
MTTENPPRPTGACPPGRPRADRARQVADVLRRQVLSEAYGPRPLPHEDVLAEEFGTSRNTVREALDLLRTEGLVRRVPGSGTLVVAEKVPHGLNRLMGLAETLHEHGEVTNEVRSFGPVRAPGPVARRLGLPEGADVVYVERVRRLNGLPLSLDLTYLAPDIGAALDAADLVHQDVFRLIEEAAGQPLGQADITLEAVNADPHSASVLEVPRGGALLMLERLTTLADGRPVDLEYVRFRGDRITMQGRLLRSAL